MKFEFYRDRYFYEWLIGFHTCANGEWVDIKIALPDDATPEAIFSACLEARHKLLEFEEDHAP